MASNNENASVSHGIMYMLVKKYQLQIDFFFNEIFSMH